jgi:hypothetical protein
MKSIAKKQLLIGVLIWLSVKCISSISQNIFLFFAVKVDLNPNALFYSVQFSSLISCLLVGYFFLNKTLNSEKSPKTLVIRLLLIYVMLELLKYVSYGIIPILIQNPTAAYMNYSQVLKTESLYNFLQMIFEHLKIILFLLIVYYSPQKDSIHS